MSLAGEFFPTLYEKAQSGGDNLTHGIAEITQEGVTIATAPGATIWERLNARDPETGEPVGYLAVKKEELSRRVQKMISPRYGRRMQFA